jgi:peptide/nickel transport system substrate-binding protein
MPSKTVLSRAAQALSVSFPVLALGISLAHAEPRFGGTLRYEIQQEGDAFVASNNTSGTAQDLGPKVFDGLLTYDNDIKPLPQLATSWTIAPDGLTYTFKLRPGVKWHDGQDFTAEDVAFSILRLKVANPRGRGTFANVKDVQTPDPLTAVLVLSKPAPYLITALASRESPILAKHVLEGTEASATPTPAQLIGTGPFVFKEWVRGDHIILERNPNYWDKPRPYLDRIVIRIISDASAIVAGFEAGEIDIGDDVSLPDLDRLKSNPKLGVDARTIPYSADYRNLTFNLDRPIVANQQVRQAIAHVIDPNVLLQNVYYGYGELAPTPISPALTKFHDAQIKPWKIDLNLAGKLLDEAGFS